MLKNLIRTLMAKTPVSKIVFQNTGDSVPGIPIGILVANPDGSELKKIRSYGSEPAWSPDGEWIAFSGLVEGYKPYACNIHIMNADGSSVRQITDHTTGGAYNPRWSNDSSQIVYYVFEDGVQHQIWTVDVRHRRRRQLAADGVSPVWTASDEIVFEKNDGSHPLMIMESDGKHLRLCPLFVDGDWSIRWSRQGDRIAFLRNRDIYVMNSDGSNLQQIRGGAVATGLSWSPEGQRLVYYGSREREDVPRGKEVYVIEADGTNETRIVANPWRNDRVAELINVCWSPRLD